MDRRIKNGEKCFSATEIAEMYCDLGGMSLHPTNVGNAANKLDLDFQLQTDVTPAPHHNHTKLYSEIDLPKIFELLKNLEASRIKYER